MVDFTKVLAGSASDPRFRSNGKFGLYAEIDGVKVGIVIATFSPNFKNFTLNKDSFDRLITAKRSGRIDEAFVIEASTSNGKGYVGFADAEQLGERLKELAPRLGALGEFWALPFNLTTDGGIEEAPF